MARKNYGRYPRFPEIKIEEYCWGEGYYIYVEGTGTPKYEDIEAVWMMLQKWIEDIMLTKADDEDCAETVVGTRVLHYVKAREAFGTKQTIKLHFEAFKEAFKMSEMPEPVQELLEVFLHDHWEDSYNRNW